MAINKSDLTEVTFYACTTRQDYEKENSKDAGGLYVLRDGQGIYRGREAVAGPAPIQIVARLDDDQKAAIRSIGTYVTYTCGYDCELSFTRLSRHLIGPGNRPVRFIDRNSNVVELYAVDYLPDKKCYILCNTYAGLGYSLNQDTSSVLDITSLSYRVLLYSDKVIVEETTVKIPTLSLLSTQLAAMASRVSELVETHKDDMSAIDEALDSLDSRITSVSNSFTHALNIAINNVQTALSKAEADLSKRIDDEVADIDNQINEIRTELSGYTDDESGEFVPGVIEKLNRVQSWIATFDKKYADDTSVVNEALREIDAEIDEHAETLSDLTTHSENVDKTLFGDGETDGLVDDVNNIKSALVWDVRLPEDTVDPDPDS